MRVHLTLGFTVMLAAACFAIKDNCPEKMRCLTTSLATQASGSEAFRQYIEQMHRCSESGAC